MYLYLVRHGETYLNKYDKMQGWSDAPLTPKGEESAKLCGERLKAVSFSALYSSDFGRTITTAKLINQKLNQNLEIIEKSAFRETFFGSYDGEHNKLSWPDVAKKNGFQTVEAMYQNLSIEQMTDAFRFADPFHDAEDYQMFWSRLSQGIDELIENHSGNENVLLVTHGNVIRHIAHQVDLNSKVAEELKNAAITLIELSEQAKQIIFYNQTELS